METSALETHNDLPAFVPEKELKAALTAAQSMARQRDELVTELHRVRRELEAQSRASREFEEASAGGDNLTRRLRLLRDALARKDQEILNLKTHTAGHAKQLKEARDTADRLRRERADLEQRLRSRDGAFVAIERERENLTRALEGARREGEQAARVVVQADSAVAEWRAALEATTRELDDARRQLHELRGAWQSLAHERQRLVETHATELATVRAEARAQLEAAREDAARALSEAAARFDAAREAHAIALRACEDEYVEELEAEREAREAAERVGAELRARLSHAETARHWAEGELAAARARLESAEAGAESIAKELQESFSREMDALRDAHDAERSSLAAAYDAELKSLRASMPSPASQRELRELRDQWAEAEGRARALAAECEGLRARLAEADASASEALREREESQAAAVELMADKDARNAHALRELRERYDDAARELDARHRAALEEARRYFDEALAAQRESHEAEVASLQDSLRGDETRVDDLERDLADAREALGTYAAESAARLAAAERAAEEAAAARDRYAKKYTEAMRELRKGGGDAAEGGDVRERAMTRFVAEAMARTVEQFAGVVAQRAGRPAPEMTDVEEALSIMSEGMPEDIADVMWSLREPFLQRCRRAGAT